MCIVNKDQETEEILQLQKAKLTYNQETGILNWTCGTKRPQGSLKSSGYIRVTIQGRQYFQHRLAWALHYGYWPNGVIDHKDRVRSNNAITNLRDVTQQDNSKNQGNRINTTSGHKGVSKNKNTGKFEQYKHIKYKKIYLGSFDTLELAIAARAEQDTLYK